MEKIFETNWAKSIFVLIIAIILYFLLETVVTKANTKLFGKTNKLQKKQKKRETYFIVANSILKYFLGIISLLIILDINGVNISSLVAGLGVVGIIVGLALQDALKDIIMGKNIITGHFFQVGDVIKYKEITGKVLSVSLKFTKIKDIYTNNIVSITNRNIDQIINLSDWLDIDIPVPYEKNVDYMKKVFSNIISEIKKIKHVKDSDIQGINEFAASNIVYKIRIYCAPETFPITKRAALEIIKREFDKENISIPYQQISIHNV